MAVKRKIVKKEKEEITVLEVFELFRVEKKVLGVSDKTIGNYEDSLKRFLQIMEMDNFKVCELEKEDVIEFVEILQENDLRAASINHYLRDLRVILYWIAREGYAEKIPVMLVKGQESIKETYTEEELQQLLQKPLGDNYCEWRSWAIINWMLSTGNRAKTVCDIQMQDINFLEREIVLRETKNKKVQVVPMSTELMFAIKKFVRDFRSDAAGEDYLFCNVGGERLSENALKLSIRDYNVSRGVNRTSIHAMRHTFAKCWIRNGGDVFRLQKMLGHSTLEMTRRYVNMFTADLAEGFDDVNPLDKFVRKQGTKHIIKKRN